MAKAAPTVTEKVVRDMRSGRLVTVRGVGALKGRLSIERGVDLTKPIAAQAAEKPKERRGGSVGDRR